jgi:outer membrane lipoprotein-sorting protein
MTRRDRFLLPLLFALGSTPLAVPREARAAESPGDRAIRLMDEAMTRAKDQAFEYEVTTQEPGKSKTKLTMRVTIKGKNWRLIEFLAPGDIKGMKALVLSISQMYVYLPAYHKVRRVASNARSQSFMGTALSQDDSSIVTYGDVYAGKLISEGKTEWKVQGARRPGKDFPYARIDFVIRKDLRQPAELVYYNDKGVKLKSETRTDYDCQNNICAPKSMKMTDHTRGGMWTEFSRRSWKIDTGIPDSAFSQRALQRER